MILVFSYAVDLQSTQDYFVQKSVIHLGGIHLVVERGKTAVGSLEELDLVVQFVELVQGRKHHKLIFCGRAFFMEIIEMYL